MPIPPQIDTLIRTRMKDLMPDCEQLRQEAEQETRSSQPRGIPTGLSREHIFLSGTRFEAIRAKFVSALQLLSENSSYIATIVEDVRALRNTPLGVDSLIGKIHAFNADYEQGMFVNLASMLEANIASDYLGQAEHLLTEGKSGNYDHVPAAVLLGAILEDTLRRICQRHTPSLSTTSPSGDPKTLNPLIEELRKANVINELKAKQLRSWADIRNKAAHGEFTEFNRHDVEQMIEGVKNFLVDYLK